MDGSHPIHVGHLRPLWGARSGPHGIPGIPVGCHIGPIEIFIILGFSYDPEPSFAITLIAVSIVAEWLGNCILYFVVRNVRVPKKIKSVVNKYIGILLVSDERMLLVNRIAPMIPYSGAFIALVDNWKLPRALAYIALGCVLKYGLILSMSSVFYAYFSSSLASIMMVVFVIVILLVSLALSYFRRKRTFGDEDRDVEE